MTIGQRITALRKEHRLSQEELGEQVGVSRQAIYKWESDASLPEINKLIALSRLFGVSVGWLLGVEEAPSTAPEETGELTEAQLKMVEEIVDRYIAAQPAPPPAKRKKWPYLAAAAVGLAALVTLGSLSGKLNRLNTQYLNLQNSIGTIQSNVNGQIGGISNRVEELLKSQNNLTASYDTNLQKADIQAGTVTFSLQATPKTYVPGMSAVFRATQSDTNEITEVPGLPDDTQGFTSELTCPLTNYTALSVVFITGETQETQLLDQYDGLYDQTVPYLSVEDYALMYHDCPKNRLEFKDLYLTTSEDSMTSATSDGFQPAEIRSVRVGLFKNQKLVDWADPCDQPASFQGFEEGAFDFYHLPDQSLAFGPEDVLTVAAVICDEAGREFISQGSSYVLDVEDSRLTWGGDEKLTAGASTEGWIF